jgi:sulfotransferase family protein
VSVEQRTRRAFFLDGGETPPARFFTDTELTDWATHWRQPMDALDKHGSDFELLDIRYEAMSTDASCELTRILDFLDVSVDPAVVEYCVASSAFEVMSGGRGRGVDAPGQHVRKGIVGDWRRLFTAVDAMLFDRVAGSRLVECSYEPDRTWVVQTPEQLALHRA